MGEISPIEAIANADHINPQEIIHTGLRLHGLVTHAALENIDPSSMLNSAQVKKLQDFSVLFETTLDDDFMNKIIEGKYSDPNDHPLQHLYNSLAHYEGTAMAKALGRNIRKPLIHIGSGWPETAIGLYRQFDVPVICVDMNAKVINEVEKALERLNLLGKNKLLMKHAFGQDILTGGEAVIISAMVPKEDKMKIISNMKDLALGDTDDPLLVLRTSSCPAYSLLYPQLYEYEFVDRWSLVKVADTQPYLKPEDFIRSFVFRVRERSEIRRGYDTYIMEAEGRLKPVIS